MRKSKEKKFKSWFFLIVMLLIYFLLFIFKINLFYLSINYFFKIILNLIPVFIFVFILMSLVNFFITPDVIAKYFQKQGIKKWFFAIIGGILSTGPIYIWYPFLANLKNKGISYGFIACFLYNRAIKIPLLPIIIFYFGWKYVLILFFVITVVSVIQGVLIDRLMKIN